MPETTEHTDPAAISQRGAELLVAAFTLAIGGTVIYGSLQQGIGWGDVGPQPGYFPFYIGLLIMLSSMGTMGIALANWARMGHAFVGRQGGARVLAVLVPTVIYVVLIPHLGMYLASALFIVWFMWRHGEHGVVRLLAIPVGVNAFFFITFELWFKVPLLKGPLERWLQIAS